MTLARPLAKALRVALIQLKLGADKQANLANALKLISEAAKNADLIVLPECFNSPYAVDQFRSYAEEIPKGETTVALSELSKQHGVYIVGGSIPELDTASNNIYNTLVVFDPKGEVIAKHRKVHLFDIDIPNGITFKELETLTGGDKATVFSVGDWGHVGLGICYDMRFPELAQIAARLPHNLFAMIYPGAFNTTTGPLHWHLLARARAVDNEVYTLLCSPARNAEGYQAYGHSLVCDPMGAIVAEAGEGQEIIYAELSPEKLALTRSSIPVNFQRRFDVYEDFVGEGKAKVSDL